MVLAKRLKNCRTKTLSLFQSGFETYKYFGNRLHHGLCPHRWLGPLLVWWLGFLVFLGVRFRLPIWRIHSLVRSSAQILLPWYFMNALNNFDKTDGIFASQYSLALQMTWFDSGGQRSRSQQVVELAKASTSTLGLFLVSCVLLFGCFWFHLVY